MSTSSWVTALSAAIICSHRASSTDRKSTRLNSSHLGISYAVFCLKKKKKDRDLDRMKQQREGWHANEQHNRAANASCMHLIPPPVHDTHIICCLQELLSAQLPCAH